MDALNAMILSLAGSPWVLVAVLLVVVVDGFFPPVPSESLVVALAAIGAATGLPDPWLVLLAAAVGSFLGDNIAFLIGRRLPPGRLRLLRGRRISALLQWAEQSLQRRPASVIVTARFIPVGRVAVNVLAGGSGFSHRRFLALSAISGVAWAGYSIAIGVLAGAWIHDAPLLGAGVAVAVALGLGVVVDRAGRLWSRRRGAAERRRTAARPVTRELRATS